MLPIEITHPTEKSVLLQISIEPPKNVVSDPCPLEGVPFIGGPCEFAAHVSFENLEALTSGVRLRMRKDAPCRALGVSRARVDQTAEPFGAGMNVSFLWEQIESHRQTDQSSFSFCGAGCIQINLSKPVSCFLFARGGASHVFFRGHGIFRLFRLRDRSQ